MKILDTNIWGQFQQTSNSFRLVRGGDGLTAYVGNFKVMLKLFHNLGHGVKVMAKHRLKSKVNFDKEDGEWINGFYFKK